MSVSVQALCQYQLKLVLCLYGIKMFGAQQGVVLIMPMAHNWCALLKFDALTFLFRAS